MRFNTSFSPYQRVLLKYLGPDYRKQLFDLGQVIYRDLALMTSKSPAGTASGTLRYLCVAQGVAEDC